MKKFIIILLIGILPTMAVKAQFMDHSFSYQGELLDGGNPANGIYDFKVQMVDSMGLDIGTASVHEDTQVANGLFNLDVKIGGIDYFSGDDDYFFEISIRPGTSTGAFTTLTDLQTLQAVPLATNLANGNATNGQVLTFNGSQWAPVNPIPSPWTLSGSNLSYNSGNVSIGTSSSATHRLDIRSGSDNKVLRLIGGQAFGSGAYLSFGDSNFVYLQEDTDDHLTIFGNSGVTIKESISGIANMKPYVYGQVNSSGTIVSNKSSSGFTVSKGATGRFTINFNDATINNNFIINVTTHSSLPKFASAVAGNDKAEIYIWTASGVLSNHAFQFVVYRK